MKVDIIIPNYNGYSMLEQCLNSLLVQTYSDFSVIVIDNASTDGSVEKLKKNYPQVTLISNAENRGFAGAVNQGIAQATAPYLLLLNNDTVVFPDFLEIMVNKLESDKKAFAVSSHMVKFIPGCPTDGSVPKDELVNDNCGDLYTLLGWAFCRGAGKSAKEYQRDAAVFSACAGAALYRRSVFEEIEWLDESFFAYREDIDLCWRAKIRGYSSIYAGDAFVYHVGSATSGSKYNKFKQFYGTRNTIWLHFKNLPLLLYLLHLPFFLLGHIVKWAYFVTKGFGGTYAKGVGAGIRGILSGKVKKTPFSLKHLGNYLKIEWEMIVNLFRVFS